MCFLRDQFGIKVMNIILIKFTKSTDERKYFTRYCKKAFIITAINVQRAPRKPQDDSRLLFGYFRNIHLNI